MSRVKEQGKYYVQHKLRENAKEIVGLILYAGAYIYVCGDGNSMAKDVYATIRDLLVQQGGVNENEAEEILTVSDVSIYCLLSYSIYLTLLPLHLCIRI
jgi:sulfite reductase alpha subunit-like flavoprotein